MGTDPSSPGYRRRSATDDSPAVSDVPERRRRPSGQRVVLTIVGVFGELLLTAGALVFLYLGWELFINNAIQGGDQTNTAIAASRGWEAAYVPAPVSVDVPKADGQAFLSDAPAFAGSPGNAEVFATLIVPRFGADWSRPIAEGIGVSDVLDTIGIGHYPGTAWPGQVGNFAVAAHRTTYGAPFFSINQLDAGDSLYVETQDGWYRYVYRSHTFVLPDGVDVLASVPQVPGAAATDRFMTLTSCNPLYSASERIIAFAVLESFTPRSDGPPAEIAHLYGAA